MSIDLIVKLARGETPSEEEIHEAHYDVCDSVHASCGSECPVYYLNGGSVPHLPGEWNCSCFKSGGKMRKFILTHPEPANSFDYRANALAGKAVPAAAPKSLEF